MRIRLSLLFSIDGFLSLSLRDFGVDCSQSPVPSELIDQQVVQFLKTFKLSPEWRNKTIKAVAEIPGDKSIDGRMGEIDEIIKRMDFR
jgi:hypothetical protein